MAFPSPANQRKTMVASLPTPRYCIQHSRFTKQDGWRLYDLSLSVNGNIAITGDNENTHRTSIDVYTSVRNSNSIDIPKSFLSMEFGKYKSGGGRFRGRLVSFVDSYDDNRGLVIATCLGDKLELLDLNQARALKSRKVSLPNHSWINCLSVREREICVGFYESKKVTLYDVTNLNEIKSIILQGIQDVDFPMDMMATPGRIFVCVGRFSKESNHRSLIFQEQSERFLSQLSKPSDALHWYADSVTVCDRLNVVVVLWYYPYYRVEGMRYKIVFYSLVSENNSSFLMIENESGFGRIRISDRGDTVVTKNYKTGEVKVYDMAEIFSYGSLKENLRLRLQTDECLRLSNFFALPSDLADTISEGDAPAENLLNALEENGALRSTNVERMIEAFTESDINISCFYLVEFYQRSRLQATPYGRFLATLSAHLTSSLPADLCGYFNISDEKKNSITYSTDPGLSLLLALDEIGAIKPSDVGALDQPFAHLRLVQAEAKIREYQSIIEEEKNQWHKQTDFSEGGKEQFFIQCLQKKIESWYETMTPVPWKKSCSWKSKDLFVGSGLVLTDSKAKRSPADIDEECKLQYEQILSHDNLKTEKRLILEGEPGSGKTMMSSQLAYDWSQGKISEVDVLVFLPLKFVNNVTLMEAVKRFYFPAYDSISVNDIESFLTNKDLRSCLILDGLEEYNVAGTKFASEPSEVEEVMKKSKYPNCKVILTSRSDYAQGLPACPMLRIGRFGAKERDIYIEKVFSDNKETQQEIRRVIENNPFILDLCSVPLLFVLAVHNIESMKTLREGKLDRVSPFIENMVKTLFALSDSTREDSASDFQLVNDGTLLEEFAYNGLCKGQQVLSWGKDTVERKVANLKQFLDAGILVVEEGVVKENVMSIQDDTNKDETSQSKVRAEKTNRDATVPYETTTFLQGGSGGMDLPSYQDIFESDSESSEDLSMEIDLFRYKTEKRISRKKRFLKTFKRQLSGKKTNTHSAGTRHKAACKLETEQLSSHEQLKSNGDPETGESSVTPSLRTESKTDEESELGVSLKTSSGHTAKDFPLEVKFLHKVMQEWFASKHFSSLLWKSWSDQSQLELLNDVLPQISPIDLHYVLRFTSYLCPPSCYLIIKFLLQSYRTASGGIPEYIMNCVCLCFAECNQENVSQVTAFDKAILKNSMDFVVAKVCREAIIIRPDDSRITHQSKMKLLRYAANVGILIKEVHLVDVVQEVDKTTSSTILTSGVTFDTFNMIEILEMSRWDQHLEQKDYQSIVKLALCSHSIKKARLHFPSQPPDVEKEELGDLVLYDKTVEWIIGPKLIQILNTETFKWEVIVSTTDINTTSPKRVVAVAAHVVAQAVNNFKGVKPEDLSIQICDIITNVTFVSDGWWKGKVNKMEGVFPCNCVKVIMLNPSIPAAKTRAVNSPVDTGVVKSDEKLLKKTNVRAKVIFSYTPHDDEELSLKVNEEIEVTNQSQQWWWEGVLNGKRGMFPSNYVILLQDQGVMEEFDNVLPDSFKEILGNPLIELSPRKLRATSPTQLTQETLPQPVEELLEWSSEIQGFQQRKMMDSKKKDEIHVESRQLLEYEELLQQPLPETEAAVSTKSVTLTIPDTKIVLNIPSNALPENSSGCVIKLRLLPRKVFKDSAFTFTSHSSVVVELLPNNLILQHAAQLTIPHCLLLKENKAPTAKIYMSHHQEGCSPCWEEQPDLEYSVGRTHCILWIKTFCWVTIKVDDKDVLAKHLILYSCGEKLMPEDKYALTAVGYYPDLDGERKFLKLNRTMIVSERSPFVFMKEGSHPLTVLLVKYSGKWELWSPQNHLNIAFGDISSSFEHLCKFVFEKTDESAQSLMCLFRAFQEKGQQAINLTICPERLDSRQDFETQMRDSSTQTQEIRRGTDIANATTVCDEDLLPIPSRERKGELHKKVEGHLIQNPKLDESQMGTSSQGRTTSSYGTLDAAVRPKIYGQRKPNEKRNDIANNTLAFYQSFEACQNETKEQRQLAPFGNYELSPHRQVGPLWSSHPFFQQNYYKQYLQISQYGPTIGTTYCMDEYTPSQGGAGLRYGVINAISKKLDSIDPLGNDWRQLADKLDFTLDDIKTFESAPSSTFAVIDCAIKSGKLKSPDQLKRILIQIGRSDAASIIETEDSTGESKTATGN